MIREAKEYMAQFPAPKHAFQYIEDRKKSEFPPNDYRYSAVGDVGYYTQFKENQKITKAITADWQDARSPSKTEMKLWLLNSERMIENGKLLYFSTFTTFEIPSSILMVNAKLYAVQADGKRILL